MRPEAWLGRTVEVLVEVPAGGRVKRRADGRADVVSPVGVPWNYGSVPGERSGDGDLLDALLLGPRREVGTRVTGRVVGVVDFQDAGLDDPKLVVGTPGPRTRLGIRLFFALYPWPKRLLHAVRGEHGVTRTRAIHWLA
ncbi:MAG: inorganic diphosphatase [Alphaproteobacteria bacterium]|nr:inorganic diphosphatase [Alphaproteobacteria bacterium]